MAINTASIHGYLVAMSINDYIKRSKSLDSDLVGDVIRDSKKYFTVLPKELKEDLWSTILFEDVVNRMDFVFNVGIWESFPRMNIIRKNDLLRSVMNSADDILSNDEADLDARLVVQMTLITLFMSKPDMKNKLLITNKYDKRSALSFMVFTGFDNILYSAVLSILSNINYNIGVPSVKKLSNLKNLLGYATVYEFFVVTKVLYKYHLSDSFLSVEKLLTLEEIKT